MSGASRARRFRSESGGDLARLLKLAVCAPLLFIVSRLDGAGPKNLTPRLSAETQSAEQSPTRPSTADEHPQISQVPQDKPKGATIEVSTRLVQASVVVVDKHGKPVSGLKKEDFT